VADTVHTFDLESMRELRRMYWEFQRELTAIKNKLAADGQDHQAGYVAEAVPFHNASGEVVPAHAVMRVTSIANEIHEIEKPNTTFKSRYLVNGPDAVAIDGYGIGTWLEKSDKVLYDTGTPAIDEEWGAKSGQWSLSENRPGFLITGDVDTTALTVRAKQHLVTDLIGQAGSGISKGSSGDVDIWMGASGAEAVTEYVIECSALGAAITADKWVVVFFRNGVWYVGPWEC
jgi:hypothetical protein